MAKLLAGFVAIIVAVGLAGCVAGASPAELRGEWVLTAGSDSTGALDPTISDVSLVINADGVEGRVCNSFGGTISGSPTKLAIGSLFSTEMYCETPAGIMELEQRFLDDLGAVSSATVDGTTLVLTGADVTLEFAAGG